MCTSLCIYTGSYSTEKEQNQVNIINILTCWWSFCVLWISIQFCTREQQQQIVAGTNEKSFVCEKICLRSLIIILAM